MRLLLLGLVVAACSDSRAPEQEERAPQRRVIEPPSGTVRLLPPYVITAEGVGPYKLRQPIAPLLDKLKSGPLRFEVPALLHSALSRAEDGTLLVGSELAAGTSSAMTFLAVVGDKVARLESKTGVGSTRDEVLKQGLAPDEPDRARDPRLLVPASARNARFVLADRKRVAAVVLTSEPLAPVPVGPRERDPCPRPPATRTAFGICLTGNGELVERDDDDLVVKFVDGRVIARVPVPNLVFAAALRGSEGHDELIAIARTTDESTQRWMLFAYRHDNGQLRRAIEPSPYPLYQLTSTQTRWIGAELPEVELYLELASKPEGIEVGGLLTTTRGGRIHDLLTISPVLAARRHPKPATTEATDAGVFDAEPTDRGSGSATR